MPHTHKHIHTQIHCTRNHDGRTNMSRTTTMRTTEVGRGTCFFFLCVCVNANVSISVKEKEREAERQGRGDREGEKVCVCMSKSFLVVRASFARVFDATLPCPRSTGCAAATQPRSLFLNSVNKEWLTAIFINSIYLRTAIACKFVASTPRWRETFGAAHTNFTERVSAHFSSRREDIYIYIYIMLGILNCFFRVCVCESSFVAGAIAGKARVFVGSLFVEFRDCVYMNCRDAVYSCCWHTHTQTHSNEHREKPKCCSVNFRARFSGDLIN